MKSTLIIICIGFLTPVFTYAQSDLVGIWDTGNQGTKVEIYENSEGLEGKVHSSENKSLEIGFVLLKDLLESEEKWSAKIYSFKRKQWFNATVTPSANALTIKISAGIKNKTVTWDRLK